MVGIPTCQSSLCWRGRPAFGESPRLLPREGSSAVELRQAGKGVAESKDTLIDIFGRIEGFFGRLNTYTKVPLTPSMMDKMVQITVEILDILAIATKEMKQNRASEFDFRFRSHEAEHLSEKFVKRVVGRTDLEDGMKRLDKLTNEEVLMAIAQLQEVTHDIDNNVTEVNEGVRRVDENVKDGVQVVNNNIKAVDNKLQTMADGRKRLSCESSVTSLTFLI